MPFYICPNHDVKCKKKKKSFNVSLLGADAAHLTQSARAVSRYERVWSLTHGSLTWVNCVSLQRWGHGGGGESFWHFEGEEAFSCFTHYNGGRGLEAHTPPTLPTPPQQLPHWNNDQANRTSFWKTAWLKTRSPLGGKVVVTKLNSWPWHAVDVENVCSTCIKTL